MLGHSHNNANEVTSRPGSNSYTYDANGNTKTLVTSAGTTAYNWDYENRLTSVVLPGSGGTVSYAYDPFGRRIQKLSPTATRNYIYDGANAIEDLDQNGGLVVRYTYDLGIDQLLAQQRSSVNTFFEQDAVGTVTSLTNSSGAIANSYVYNEFGQAYSYNETVTNNFHFGGRNRDSEDSLDYFRARYYDEATGRFLNEDPLRLSAGNPDFYPFVRNNPTNFKDPLGLKTQVVITYDSYFGINLGSHSGVYIDNSGNPMLYDPAGAYAATHHCGTGDACTDKDASLRRYKKFQQSSGSTVKVFTFDTTSAEEAQIAKNIDALGGALPGACTTSVTTVLQGVGPFQNLQTIFWPGNLADALESLQNPNPAGSNGLNAYGNFVIQQDPR